jgi:hypothetical protein
MGGLVFAAAQPLFALSAATKSNRVSPSRFVPSDADSDGHLRKDLHRVYDLTHVPFALHRFTAVAFVVVAHF